ncbi:amino acid ABC transporter permease [Nitrincola alkalilacustris]|uniref:amino acid ABC transporter permease n=1 Tax=Nitrincola alkalilacustris TaxID=1571224 RepID=UPI00124DDAC1|nr:amino acid ABC transporter permease [Nitrincola alkalilacustris]
MKPKNNTGLLRLVYNPTARSIFYQVVIVGLLLWFVLNIVGNVMTNLDQRGISTGFRFLSQPAGFGISQSLIEYDETFTFGRTFFVGLLNTLLISALGIITATILGVFVGISRLSPNWLLRKLSMVYIEILRNIPLLLQIFFWYYVVLQAMPRPRDSISIGEAIFINVRGISMPKPVADSGFGIYVALIVAAIIGVIVLARWANKRMMDTGQQFPTFWASVGILLGTVIIGFFLTGRPLVLDYPELRGLNFRGGMTLLPELLALWFALTIYTSTYIAEIVRSGIESVSHGQTEACRALGLNEGQRLKLVILPQAMRVMIPPMTSQYLNLAKNSSLATAIGYPDLVSVFAGTTLNQTGQAIEIISMTMLVYLTISLSVSAFMNWFNRRMALVER